MSDSAILSETDQRLAEGKSQKALHIWKTSDGYRSRLTLTLASSPCSTCWRRCIGWSSEVCRSICRASLNR